MTVDKENGESHYKQGGMEPITFIEANQLPFAEGCIVKYAARHAHKERTEAVKDLFDIAIYAYLILKHRYETGPLYAGHKVPSALEWYPKAGTPSAPSIPPAAPSLPVIGTSIDWDRNTPTAEQFAELWQLVRHKGELTPMPWKDVVARAINAVRKAQAGVQKLEGGSKWTPHTIHKCPREAIGRTVRVILADGAVETGRSEAFQWNVDDIVPSEQLERVIVAWQIAS